MEVQHHADVTVRRGSALIIGGRTIHGIGEGVRQWAIRRHWLLHSVVSHCTS